MEDPRRDARTKLAWLVDRFDREAGDSRKMIREMLQSGAEGFLRDALELLRERPDSRGSQYVVALLVSNNLLLPALCDPGLSLEQALALARTALRVDCMADMTLAKALVKLPPDRSSSSGRLMKILDAVADGNRILPSLLPLMRHVDPHIRSKVVLMIGRGGRGMRWAERRLADEDPRVRANAIESIWGVDSLEARELLRRAMADAHNRVAGNALMGLYLLGEEEAIPAILRMAESQEAATRATALWVMGQTGDPGFLAAIVKRLRDLDVLVRQRALRSFGRIKAALALQGGHAGQRAHTRSVVR